MGQIVSITERLEERRAQYDAENRLRDLVLQLECRELRALPKLKRTLVLLLLDENFSAALKE